MKLKIGAIVFLFTLALLARGATNDLTVILQKGLFEEEANRDIDAAITNYELLVAQADKDRQVAATAVFRLGECYRKLGRTNDAVAQYERIVRDYSDQATLVALSRQNLAGLGSTPTAQADFSQRLNRILAEASSGPSSNFTARLQALIGRSDLQNGPGEPATTDDEQKEIRRIQSMIQNSPDLINAADGDNGTPLYQAAAKGQVQIAEFLLDHRARIDQVSGGHGKIWESWTPLIGAADYGHKAMVELLLKRGAEANAKDAAGSTALHHATRKGFRAVAEALLAGGADLKSTDDYRNTPLHIAVNHGQKELAALLIEHGADVNAPGDGGWTPIFHADGDIAKMLLEAKADPNVTDRHGRTPLSVAVQDGATNRVRLLLDARADPNSGSLDLPLLVAALAGDSNSAAMLLRAGARPQQKGKIDWTMQIGGQAANNGGAFSALEIAIATFHSDVARLLLKFKADVNARDVLGTPLIFDAVPNLESLRALLDAGADLNIVNDRGDTPLMMAVGNGDAVHLLVDRGAQVNVSNADGDTPLHHAVGLGNADVVEFLIARGADVNALNHAGHTPLELARQGANAPSWPPLPTLPFRSPPTPSPAGADAETIAKLLRQHGAVEDVPKFDRISVRRSTGKLTPAVFWKGTNDWNHFTLMETLLSASKWNTYLSTPGGGMISSGDFLGFPDLSRLIVHRPGRKPGEKEKLIEVNFLTDAGVDCAKDVPLEFGDVVEIPVREHPLNEHAGGLPDTALRGMEACLRKHARLVVRGQSRDIELAPYADPSFLSYALGRPEAQSLLLSSSDLSRVKVTRKNPATGKTTEFVENVSQLQPLEDIWLRDGDVIEVPERTSADPEPAVMPGNLTPPFRYGNPVRNIPTRPLPLPSSPQPPGPSGALSPEEQIILMEAQRMQAGSTNNNPP